MGFTLARIRAGLPPNRPRRPDLGSWITSYSRSLSSTPSTVRAASTASSTVRPVVSTHSIYFLFRFLRERFGSEAFGAVEPFAAR